MDPRLRRITLLIRQYGARREGVTRAIWAPCILAVGAVEYFNIHRGLWGVIFGLLNIFSWSALGIGLWLVARKWMDRRFGRVQSDSPVAFPALLLAWMAAGLIDLALLFKALPHRPEERHADAV